MDFFGRSPTSSEMGAHGEDQNEGADFLGFSLPSSPKEMAAPEEAVESAEPEQIEEPYFFGFSPPSSPKRVKVDDNDNAFECDLCLSQKKKQKKCIKQNLNNVHHPTIKTFTLKIPEKKGDSAGKYMRYC